MGLDNFYNLRENFIILGLTGKMQAGADIFSQILSKNELDKENKDFLEAFLNKYKQISASETRKFRRLKDFFDYDNNWKKFEIIEYKKVVLLFILYNCYSKESDEYVSNICKWMLELKNIDKSNTPFLGNEIGIAKESTDFINGEFKDEIKSNINRIKSIEFNNTISLEDN